MPIWQRLKSYGEETHRSNDQCAQLQSQEWKGGDRSISQKSKREEGQRWKGKLENAINGKQRDSVQGEMFAASATTKVSVERTHTRPLLPQERRHKRRGKEVHQEEVVFRRGNIKKACRKDLKGNCTNPLCDCWHPPVCQHHKTELGCKFGDKCLFWGWQSDQQKAEEKWWKRISSLIEGIKTFGLRFPGYRAAEIEVDLRKSTKSLGSDRTVRFSKGTLHHVKNRKWRVHRKGVIQKCEPQERNPCAPKIEDRTQEETLQQEPCARREAWDLAKKVCNVKKTRPRSSLLQKFGHYQHHLRRNLRKDSWYIREHQCTCWAENLSSEELKPFQGPETPRRL